LTSLPQCQPSFTSDRGGCSVTGSFVWIIRELDNGTMDAL
jgi:hypothetical protein